MGGKGILLLRCLEALSGLLQSVTYGHGFVAYSPIQLSDYGGNKDADIYSYNPQKFAEEMEKLGWKKGSDGIYERNGQKFHFTCHVNANEVERVDIANLAAKNLKELGVNMEVFVLANWDFANYDSFLCGYAAEFDPDMMYVNYVTGASDNSQAYSNPEVDRLLNAGRHETDYDKRVAIYNEFEEAYAEDPAVVLITYLDANFVGIPGIQGMDTSRVLGHHAVGVLWNIEEWTLTK